MPCRIYVLVAARENTALVLRRGPTDWWHLLRWDLAALTLSPGAWFHGALYPRRCDISWDGRLFGYFARKNSPQWPEAYFAVSRLPWLEALAAWETCGTWTWGCQWWSDGQLEIRACMNGKPFHGSYPRGFSVSPMETDWAKRDLWNESKRGWNFATEDDPLVASYPAMPGLVMRRERPGGSDRPALGLIHHGVDFLHGGIEGAELEYFLEDTRNGVAPIPEAAWADWDHKGRLLLATREGCLEVCRCHGTRLERVWSVDLRERTPDPQPAPAWASEY